MFGLKRCPLLHLYGCSTLKLCIGCTRCLIEYYKLCFKSHECIGACRGLSVHHACCVLLWFLIFSFSSNKKNSEFYINSGFVKLSFLYIFVMSFWYCNSPVREIKKLCCLHPSIRAGPLDHGQITTKIIYGKHWKIRDSPYFLGFFLQSWLHIPNTRHDF